MRVEINLKQLSEAVSVVSRAVSSRPQLPVLSNILFEAEATGIRLSATDLEIGMSLFLPAKVSETGRVTVPARTFFDYVSSLSGEKIEMAVAEGALAIKAGTFSGQMQTISAEEFPKIETEAGSGAEMSSQVLFNAIPRVLFAVAKDSLRPVLTGVLFEFGKNKLRLVGTDGFRLSVVDVEVTNPNEEKYQFVLPARAASEMAKLAKEGQVMLSFIPETKQVIAKAEKATLTAQVLDGNFPDYNKILPKNFVINLSASREELLAAVRSVSIFARENSNVMRMKIAENELSVLGEAQEKGQAKANCPVRVEDGESAEVVFNARYVMDFLATSTAMKVTIGLGEALAPGAFREEGKSDYLYVVMPINA